ncbi:MAG: hypothetical protein KGJ86_08965 [Chloroflexota bacterium]|nr:hypothetical protein [Chloroflexota bacterium]
MPRSAESSAKLAALEREGWQLQFTTEEPRLSEMVELYESLGYEVRVEAACNDLPRPECAACYEAFCDKYKTIFVRQPGVRPIESARGRRNREIVPPP